MDKLIANFFRTLVDQNLVRPYGSKFVLMERLLKKHLDTYLVKKKLVIEQQGGKIIDVYMITKAGKQSLKFTVVDNSE